jgi:predicted ATP-dependent endonuclease of OLD family
MKIQKLTLQNIKSFRDEVSIEFKKGINIFIGPNAGGKSNLMDILNISLCCYFIWPWRLVPVQDTPSGHRVEKTKDRVFSQVGKSLEKYLGMENQEQRITLSFEITDKDLKNIEIIKNNQNKLIEFEKSEYKSNFLSNGFRISNDVFSHSKQKIVEFQIGNHSTPLYNENDCSEIFLKYLNCFELVSILIEEYNKKISSSEEKIEKLFPLIMYFSPYRITTVQNLSIKIAGYDPFDIMEKYKKNTSKDVSSILEYASFYFAEKFRNYDDDLEKFKQDDEVKSIQEYIKKLGYDCFEMTTLNKRDNVYEIELKKNHENIKITSASSGEKEIISLLLGIFAFDVKEGVVIIDEPELHLHPRWQKILLELFDDLYNKRKIQFFIVTHSPQFITTTFIKNTFRIYKESETSKIFIPKREEMEKPDIKDIFQIVNVLNNEKIFFADKVILVEGVVDRIIYGKILKNLQKAKKNSEVIEIIEVKGKKNFIKFKTFLETWKIKHYIFADLDYLVTIGDTGIKNSFNVDFTKIKNMLGDKNSKDAKNLLEALDDIIVKVENKNGLIGKDVQDIKELYNYIKNRHISLKENITGEDKKKIESYIENKYQDNIFILKEGEIEDYFGGGHFDIKKAIEMAQSIKSVENIHEEFVGIFKNVFK